MKGLAPLALLLLCGCATADPVALPQAAAVDAEGIVDDDAEIVEYVLRNASGSEIRFLNYGAIITAIGVPDRAGNRTNVVLGYGSESEYRELNGKNLFGAVVGRYAGRIEDARFIIDGTPVQLQPNLAGNALHGGAEPGIAFKLWDVRPFTEDGVAGAELTLVDPDGSQGFPGELTLSVTYRLLSDDAVRIDYAATTDAPTVLNVMNHTYFNLAGRGTVTDHLLQVNAERYAATNSEDIPTGAFPGVAGTPLDFREATRIGALIDADHPVMNPERGGYNHSWEIAGEPGSLRPAARLFDPASGRTLDIETSAPSLHAYTGDYFDGADLRPDGSVIAPRDGIALETQSYSDSPNRPEFPSTALRPGEVWRSTTIWRFGTR